MIEHLPGMCEALGLIHSGGRVGEIKGSCILGGLFLQVLLFLGYIKGA